MAEGTADDARMWEIAENLHRADLTALERDEHVAEWIGLAAKVRQPDAVFTGRGNEGGVRKAARDLGMSEADARRAVHVAALAPDAKAAARDAGLADNRTALLHAAKQPPEQQAAAIREYQPAPRVKPAPVTGWTGASSSQIREEWRFENFSSSTVGAAFQRRHL